MKQMSMIMPSNFEIKGHRVCEICGTKVQIIYVKSQDKTVSECLNCENNKLQSEFQKQFEQQEKSKNEAVFKKHSFIPNDIQSARFSTYMPDHSSKHDALRIAMTYAKNFQQIKSGKFDYQSLLFQGTYGIGKSHLAHSIAKEVVKKGFSAIFIDVPQLLQFFRNNIQSKTMDEHQIMKIISNVDLLIFDDLGAEYIKQENGKESWGTDKLFQVFSLRNNKPKIITTNYNARKLQDKYGHHGGRIISRMMMGTKRVAMEGQDYRMKICN